MVCLIREPTSFPASVCPGFAKGEVVPVGHLPLAILVAPPSAVEETARVFPCDLRYSKNRSRLIGNELIPFNSGTLFV
jgi:hypothetical protein